MQRAVFFVIAAAICALLAWPAQDFAWAALGLAAVYLALALGSFLDARGR
ncbi:MAG: hypothetical protein ACRDJP_06270 [Actinomycetota bacterium]